TSGIQNELISSPRVVNSFPTYTFSMEVLESAGPILARYHLRIGGNTEVFRNERMPVHLAAKDQRQLDGAADQFISLKLRLTAGDIERGDQLKVRGSAGMSEERLFERSFRAFPAIIVHHDIGTLT